MILLRSISEESLKRYVQFASENCIQELLSASVSNRTVNGNEGWKVLGTTNGVEISKRRSGSLHTFRSRWVLESVSPEQFIAVATAIDAAKVSTLGLIPPASKNSYLFSRGKWKTMGLRIRKLFSIEAFLEKASYETYILCGFLKTVGFSPFLSLEN